MRIKNRRGFTLIELMVAIGILGILSIAAITALNPLAQLQKAADARKKSDLAQIQRALETYYHDHQAYPNSGACNGVYYQIQGSNGDGNSCVEWGSSWQPYMNNVPKDPAAGVNYAYVASSDLQSYYLYASFDNKNDTGLCNSGAACQNAPTTNNPCGANRVCDYGVSSPDVSP